MFIQVGPFEIGGPLKSGVTSLELRELCCLVEFSYEKTNKFVGSFVINLARFLCKYFISKLIPFYLQSLRCLQGTKCVVVMPKNCEWELCSPTPTCQGK